MAHLGVKPRSASEEQYLADKRARAVLNPRRPRDRLIQAWQRSLRLQATCADFRREIDPGRRGTPEFAPLLRPLAAYQSTAL